MEVNMFSNNCNGANLKVESLKFEIKRTNSSIFTLQETHFSKKGRVKIEGFEVFEAIRMKEHGTMLGAHVKLQPVLISEYSETFELLVVQVKVEGREIRLITGYGPQENQTTDKTMPFFSKLEEEIVCAKLANKSVIIQMDANSKLGREVIPNDPKNQSPNGAILSDIIERNGLIVANSITSKCKGVITRRRTTDVGVEESIIDFLIISADLLDNIKELFIDEEKEHALTKITHCKKTVKKVTSDHNVMLSKFSLTIPKSKITKRVEVFNYRNKANQAKFTELTSSSTYLSEVFNTTENINIQTEVFLKRLNKCINKSFKKIRLGTSKPSEYERLYKRWVEVRYKDDDESKLENVELESELADKFADNIFEKIKEEIDGMNCEDGAINSGKLWKLKKKLHKNFVDPPTAMKDSNGNMLTKGHDILDATVKHYQKVLENRTIKEGMEQHKKEREDLAKQRLEYASRNKTPDWDMDDITEALKSLKNNKSSDGFGYINELFKPSVIGSDLKLSVLKLMNKIKQTQEYPHCLELCNITSIFKNKGNKSEFNNYRGIFRVVVFRGILERLIYHDEYQNIDFNLSDANVGARKGRNIRDNLFVVNAVMNSVKRGTEEAVDICAYDAEKCFDSLWTYECINDLYDSGLQNDKLAVLFAINKNAQVAIKTSHGMTKRVNIPNIIMQGTVWGSMFCTTTIDQLSRKSYTEESLLYKYKGEVSVPPLGMVDDVLTIQKCGATSMAINSEVNAFFEQKKLKLAENKCFKIHVGSKCGECEILYVHGEKMKEAHEFKYLGDLVNENGRAKSTINQRISRGYAIVSQIFALLSDLPIGNLRVQIGLALRHAWLINGILFNSEAWHGITKEQISQFVEVDKYLLRGLVGAHAKVPLEHIYLELSALPIPYVLSVRRMVFLYTILKRHDDEITKKVYLCQKRNPLPGDWCGMISEDFLKMGIVLTDEQIVQMQEVDYKKLIKSRVNITAFNELEQLKQGHSKVKDNIYTDFKHIQPYFLNRNITNRQMSLMFSLRSKTLRSIKCNFPKMYSSIMCPLCQTHEDTQESVILCKVLLNILPLGSHIEYEHMNGTTEQQTEFLQVYERYLMIRDELLDKSGLDASLPGLYTGPVLPQAASRGASC